jgi:uncharacterized protein (TIGR02246 family)
MAKQGTGKLIVRGMPMDPQDEAAVKAVVDRFVQAWNEHDMRAFAGLFTDDAAFVNAIGLRWRGRAQIEEAQTRNHATIFKESRLDNVQMEQRLLKPDIAVVHATWDLVGQRRRDGQTVPPRTGVITMILTKNGTAWPIAVFQNTDVVVPS